MPPLASTSDLKLVWLEDFVARLTKAALPGAHLSLVLPWLRRRGVDGGNCLVKSFGGNQNCSNMSNTGINWLAASVTSRTGFDVKDIWYEGHFIPKIPKGSMPIPNVWAMDRDPDIYGLDTHHFNPARYLDQTTGQLKTLPAETKDQVHVTFDYGRQIENEDLFITMATGLWTIKTKPEVRYNALGVPIDIYGCVYNGVIVSRFPEAVKVLKAAEDDGVS
ncbi:cytochrome P450 2C3 [Colletotrichum orchidophilum]|uniref:Cytochrome P450 2C3 n=1 Tax=Colletotrichum orchidophilum TaxID=1209926 RepID=A0A1G4B380_9PEZI|nr:cytochrome P450 2C3 [Colletotrichum orchidophilum]OHE95870.1 cytochrome P450 2C3 [Colletotrichum orchidophilum]